jgi:hypothetical protein
MCCLNLISLNNNKNEIMKYIYCSAMFVHKYVVALQSVVDVPHRLSCRLSEKTIMFVRVRLCACNHTRTICKFCYSICVAVLIQFTLIHNLKKFAFSVSFHVNNKYCIFAQFKYTTILIMCIMVHDYLQFSIRQLYFSQ